MKRIFCQILGCWVMVFVIAANNAAMAEPEQSAAAEGTGAACIDSMQTVPIADDLEPTPIAVDGGCMVSEAAISI